MQLGITSTPLVSSSSIHKESLMIEIRYKKDTGILTGWWSDRFGNHKKKLKYHPNEAIVKLDIPIPNKPLKAWLYDGESLVDNPDYVELALPRNPMAEIDELKARIQRLEKL